ncbi:phospholipid carrier-dependent glycosyltransferase [bacterium]|nr:phospholipid carrier-dependent glycosyltransferase [bacterium]
MNTDHSPSAQEWTRRFWLVLAGVFVFRLAYLALVPIDLVPDEAYYWDWSRRLDWCYYSKPPMVAWLMALSTRLFGVSEFAVRLQAAVLNTAALAAVFLLGRAMFGSAAGFMAAVSFLVTPGNFFAGTLSTIDPPLIAFWSLSLYLLWRAVAAEDGGLWWWLAAGVCGALGVLSKQMMLAMPALVLVHLAFCPRHRAALRRPGVYLFIIITLLGLVPIIHWNIGHNWVTLRHTGEHFNPGRVSFFRFISTFFYFVGTQMCVISPLMWLVFVAVIVMTARHVRTADERVRFLLVLTALPLAVVALMSLRQRIHPNWPAVFYIAGSVLAGAWACGGVSCGTVVDYARRYYRYALGLGVLMSVVAAAGFPLAASSALGEKVLAKGLGGWRSLGRQVGERFAALPDRDRVFIAGVRREVTAELAFYLPGRPQVYEWPMDIYVQSQYGVWGGPTNKLGWNGLVVMDAKRQPSAEMRTYFSFLEDAGEVVTEPGGRRFHLYLGRGLNRWHTLK